MTGPVTTVVITRDRVDQLLQTLPRHEGPVIVVDNASSDGTAAAALARQPGVRVIVLPRNVAGAARNVGVEAATTAFVAFSDDDSWWEPGSLARAAGLMAAHPSLAVLAARVVVEPGGREDPFNEVLAKSPLPGSPDVPGRPILGFMACAAMVRREAFLDAGGFHRLLGVGGEEQVLAWDLAARGWDLRYEPSLLVHHEPRPSGARGARRMKALRRSAVIAGLLRRPWPDVGRTVLSGLGASGPDRAGVGAAAVRLGPALAGRRVLPRAVREQIRVLGD